MKYKMLMDACNLFQDSDVIICKTVLSPGQRIPPHWHDYFEYETVLSGHARHIYNGKAYSMERGYTYLLSYCDYHSFHSVDNVTVLNVRFRESMLNRSILKHITQKPNKLICALSEEETEKVADSIMRLNNEVINPKAFSDIIKTGIISDLVISLIRHSANECPRTMPHIIQLAITYINTNFRDGLTLEHAAHALSLSPNYLGALFKKHTGASFSEYLNRTRLKYACSLLLSSELTVKEIAFASGYSSLEYFSYVFKKIMHISPGKYRSHNRNYA